MEGGYKVRGTVRSEAKGEYLKDLFKSPDFEYVLVDDITKVRSLFDQVSEAQTENQDGIFDEAVKDVDAVAHTASPFHFKASHPDELIGPALKGTTGVLKSIQKNK